MASDMQKRPPSKELPSRTTYRYVKGTTIEKPPSNDDVGVFAILTHPINTLLMFLPMSVGAYFWDWGELQTFWFSFAAMIPLAKILGDATEELAASLKNETLAGLLNATFGNAVEMVITVQTLRAGLFNVVKATLLGSVLSNTLLVLGMSFFCGGIWSMKKAKGAVSQYQMLEHASAMQVSSSAPSAQNDSLSDGEGQRPVMMMAAGEKIQSFSVLGALVNTSMLLISSMSFDLITVFRTVIPHEQLEEVLLPVSRISSVIIMLAYCAYIVFQFVTHKDAMAEEGGDEDGDEQHLSVCKSLVLLFATTVVVAGTSEILVHAIAGVTESAHMSQSFIGIILLPIVGNACEHAAAVRFAVQDKLGLSVSIAIGSSTQIALFVVPFSVLVGWIIGKDMDLDFGCLNSSMITLSVIVVLSMVVDGQSNWLQGYLLCSVYVIIAVMYWYLPDDLGQAP